MAWLESHQALSRHKKTLRAAGLLKCNRHQLIGHLHELWWWGIDNVPPDGDLGDLTDYEIAMAAEWQGDAEEFVAALTDAGFIDVEGERRFLHDWYDYAGKWVERREKERERAKQRRANDQSEDKPPSKGRPSDRTPDGTTDVAPTWTGTREYSTEQDITEPQESESLRAPAREKGPDSLTHSVDLTSITRHYHHRIGMLNDTAFDKLRFWHEEKGMDADVVCKAIDITADQAERPRIGYVEGILVNWYNDGVRTTADLRTRDPTTEEDYEAAIAALAAQAEEADP